MSGIPVKGTHAAGHPVYHVPLALLLVFLLPVFLLPGGVVAAQSVEERLEGEWVRFALTGRAGAVAEWGATSVLESDLYWEDSRYDPGKALDGDAGTAWVEGAPGEGIGEAIILAFTHYPEALGFINGFATETVTLYDALPAGPAHLIHLADRMVPQRVTLPLEPAAARNHMSLFRDSSAVAGWTFPQARTMGVDSSTGLPVRFRYILRLEIARVYRGSTWEDTCIAEIWPDFGEVRDVTVSENMRYLLLATREDGVVPGYRDFHSVLTLLDTSENADWALVIREPAYHSTGRVSSEYAVIHSATGRDMTSTILGPEHAGYLPFAFQRDGGADYVIYEDEAGEVRRALCVSPYGDGSVSPTKTTE